MYVCMYIYIYIYIYIFVYLYIGARATAALRRTDLCFKAWARSLCDGRRAEGRVIHSVYTLVYMYSIHTCEVMLRYTIHKYAYVCYI